jgi:predicted  nucleic acid-binding Zn-ribbon protein
VKEELEYLIKLQYIDLRIIDKKRMIDKIPLKMGESELSLNTFRKDINKIKQRLDSLERQKRDKERALDDMNEKIEKLKARTADIKTNKEYQAHLKEIEAAEKDLDATEDQILVVMEEIDTSLRQMKLEEANFKIKEDNIKEFKKKLEGDLLEAEKELLPLEETRSKIVDALDRELYDQYLILFKSCKGVAVTEAKEEICMGCNMNIPPQLFVEVKKNEEIINCPQCRRILYCKNNTEP